MPRAIALKTYEMFRKKYKITKKRDKTLKEIQLEIYNYEKANQSSIINGLYFNVLE